MIFKIVDGVSIPLTELEIIEHNKAAIPIEIEADRVRRQRNILLVATDWTQVVDAPQAIKDIYTTYRQALRDVPAQAGFPWVIDWPVQP